MTVSDPLDWTVDHVNSWVTWLTTTFDLPIFGDFRVKLYDCPLDGRTLTQWSSDDFCRLFGPNGDLIHENFRRWLNGKPKFRDKIGGQLFRTSTTQNRLTRGVTANPLQLMDEQGPIS